MSCTWNGSDSRIRSVAGQHALVAHAEHDVLALEAAGAPELLEGAGDGLGLEHFSAAGSAVAEGHLGEADDGGARLVDVGDLDRTERSAADVDSDDVLRHGVVSFLREFGLTRG
jgi:hypothetical protein